MTAQASNQNKQRGDASGCFSLGKESASCLTHLLPPSRPQPPAWRQSRGMRLEFIIHLHAQFNLISTVFLFRFCSLRVCAHGVIIIIFTRFFYSTKMSRCKLGKLYLWIMCAEYIEKISWNSNSYRALSSSNKIVFE